MIGIELKKLIEKLNSTCKKALESAAGLCVSRGSYEISLEHLFLKMLDEVNSDIACILRHFEIEPERLKGQLTRAIETAKAGNPRKPVFSTLLIELLEDAWVISSLEIGATQTRTGAILLAMVSRRNRYLGEDYYSTLERISPDALKSEFLNIVGSSGENAVQRSIDTNLGAGHQRSDVLTALNKFAINFTEQARQGKIDPVFGRDQEIRQMVDILARRRKNNPIIVGEPGVGKTAVVEGLALRIIENDVPAMLSGVELYALDIGLLQAGASVKGEFEQRLNSVINEVKSSVVPIVLFIDEAHTLIGAGGTAGGSDAANLLKPALARGELKTIAATTWSEYKKYFEKDPALARRFQVVKVDEPSIENATLILRGLREKYESAHGIYVHDSAVMAASQLSARYISGRQLPDKSVDLLDTACARVKISLSAKPSVIDGLERQLAAQRRAFAAVDRDIATGLRDSDESHETTQQQMIALAGQIEVLTARWKEEKAWVEKIVQHRRDIAALKQKSDGEQASECAKLEAELSEIESKLKERTQGDSLIDYEVTPEVIAKVVADWTGIPTGDMVKSEADAVLRIGENLKRRIKGQDQAVSAIERGIQAAKTGLNNPNTPLGVFLFVGPSGVGKTECALTVADLLFGGERFVATINMSEYQEKHSVSRLIGSPPGYVGYGEGGVLTEAVRQRPYSVVLLDEVEKADPEVLNLFYQVFDKGVLSDSEGRVIDFKNTVIILTSNLATDAIMQLCADGQRPDHELIAQQIRPILNRHFKPALLARMEVVPFYPVSGDILGDIVRLKLDRIVSRLKDSQKIAARYTDNVVQTIVQRCSEVETGARNIDHIVNRRLLPGLSTEILRRMNGQYPIEKLVVDIGGQGEFVYDFS